MFDNHCIKTKTLITRAETPPLTSVSTFCFFIIAIFKVKKTKRAFTLCSLLLKVVLYLILFSPSKKTKFLKTRSKPTLQLEAWETRMTITAKNRLLITPCKFYLALGTV